MLDPVIRQSLCMFLPYVVRYKSNIKSEYTVFLLHPIDDFRIAPAQFRPEGRLFLEANKQLLESASKVGRATKSAAHAQIAKFNASSDNQRVFEIDGEISGKRPYTFYASGPDREGEYDITKSGDLYPTFVVVRQKDGLVVGAVSIDLKESLQERVVGVLNSYFTAFEDLSVWNFSQYDLIEGFRAQCLDRLFAPRSKEPCFHNGIAPEHRAAFMKEFGEKVANVMASDAAIWLVAEAEKTADNDVLHNALKPFGSADRVFQPSFHSLSQIPFSTVTASDYIQITDAYSAESWRQLIAAIGRFMVHIKEYGPVVTIVRCSKGEKVLVIEYSMPIADRAFHAVTEPTDVATSLERGLLEPQKHDFCLFLGEILKGIAGNNSQGVFKAAACDAMPEAVSIDANNKPGILGFIVKHDSRFKFRWILSGGWK